MTSTLGWLPQLVTLDSYDGDWDLYLDTIYKHFEQDFCISHPFIGQAPVTIACHNLYKGKEDTFWHVISKDDRTVTNRLPNLRRCERIRWPRAVIEHINSYGVLSWKRWLDGRQRTIVWVEEADYVVVIIHRYKCYALLTAYYVEGKHSRENLRAQYNLYK